MTTAINVAGLIVAAVGVGVIIWGVWVGTIMVLADRRRDRQS